MSFARTLAAAALSVGLGVSLVVTDAPFSAAEDAATPVSTASATPTGDAAAADTTTSPTATSSASDPGSATSSTEATTPSASSSTSPSVLPQPKPKKKLSKSALRAGRAVSYAKRQIGDMYGWGATGPKRFDCSGLTYASYRATGKRIPRTSWGQWRGLKHVKIKNLRPGDIVVYYGGRHVGIYVGGGKIVHSSRPGKPIKKVKLHSMPIKGAVRP